MTGYNDYVWRTRLSRKLQNCEIKGKCFKIIYNMYNEIKSCVQYNHFFRNACTKSGSLRFHSFPVVDFVCLYIYGDWAKIYPYHTHSFTYISL
jgi:hypothetical protein